MPIGPCPSPDGVSLNPGQRRGPGLQNLPPGPKQQERPCSHKRSPILKLTTPARQASPDPTLDIRPRSLQDWCEALPILAPERTAGQLRERLQRLNRQPLPASQRLELLGILAAPYWRMFHALLATPAASITADLAASLSSLQRCCQELSFGYKIAVQDSPDKTSLFGGARTRQQAILLAIRYLGQQLNHRYASYQRAPASLWSEIDQLYRHARQRGFHQVSVPGHARPYQTIEQAFLAAALMKIGDPFQLPVGGLWETWRYLDHHLQQARLEPWNDACETFGAVYLPATDPLAEGFRQGLTLDLRPLLQVASQELEQLAQGRSPADYGFSERLQAREAARILERMLKGWRQQVERKERQALQADVEVAPGLEAAFCFINRGLAFDRHAYRIPAEDEEEEIDLGRRSAQWDPAQDPGFSSLSCRVLDHSPGGIGMHCNRPPEEAPRIGQLIALRTRPRGDDQAGDWFAASPRWLRIETHGFELGAQYLARAPLPVAVRIRPPGKGSQEFHPALRAALRQADRLWHILITPPGLFAPGRPLELVHGGKTEQGRCVKLLESGSGFERFQFEPL